MNTFRYLSTTVFVYLQVAALGTSLAPTSVASEFAKQLEERPGGAMSPQLKSFLAAEDLDDVAEAREKIKALDARDTAVVRSILKKRQPPQAVSNLLINPTLIPEDVRLTTLLGCFTKRKTPYYALAAVVGVAEIKPDKLSVADRKRVVTGLLAVIRETSDIRATRASVSFQSFARESDAPQVIDLLDHPDATVRHNLWAWLFNTFADGETKPFAAAVRRSGLPEKAQRQVVSEFTEFVTSPHAFVKSTGSLLFSYIPNLRDFKSVETRRSPLKTSGERVIPPLARIKVASFANLIGDLSDPKQTNRLEVLKSLRRLAPLARKSLTREQLTSLSAVLKDRSVEVRTETAAVLGRLGADARPALPALFDAAKDTSSLRYITTPGSVTEAAAEAALRIDPECGPALAKYCLHPLIAALKGNDQDDIRAASLAIARLGKHAAKAIPALAEALKTARGYSVGAVLQALTAVAGEANKPLGDFIRDPKSPLDNRRQALATIGERQTPEEEQIAILIEALKDRKAGIRAVAIESLARLGPRAKAATPALLALLGDADLDQAAMRSWVKEILAGALTRMGETAVPGLAAVVRDETKPVLARIQAIRALGKMGQRAKAAQPALAAAMKDRNHALKVESAGVFPMIGGDIAKALPILKSGLKDESLPIILAAVSAVERLGVRASALAPNLLPLLKHRARDVRLSTVRAVATMGPAARPAVSALAELLKSGDGRRNNKDLVAEAIQRLGPDAAAALPALIERLKNLQKVSPNPVILAIGKLGRDATAAVPALVRLIEKDDPSWPFFSTDAIDALGEIGPEARTAVPTLIIQLRKSSESNRARAAEALGRIGPGARAAVPELEKRLKDVRLRVRIWAAFALIRITGDSKRRMSLLISLWSKDEDLYLAEAFGILGAEARPARDLLLQALADEDTPSGILHRVARALGQLRDDADLIVPRLLALMESPAVRSARNNSREYVIEALGLLGPSAKAAIPRLRVLAEDNDDVIARTASRALEKIEGK